MKNRSRTVAILFAFCVCSTLVRADLAFKTCLTGDQENPAAVVTDATGKVKAHFDCGLTQVDVRVDLSDLVGFTAAHFHCARAGQNGPVVFGLINPGPCTLQGDEIECTLTNANFSGNDCTAAIGRQIRNIAALYDAMQRGEIYFNAHTQTNPGGEIRGRLRESDACGDHGGGGNDDDEGKDRRH